MAAFIIRRKITPTEASELLDAAMKFFSEHRRRRMMWIGDSDGLRWFKVRRGWMLDDISAHAEQKVSVSSTWTVVE